MNTEQATVKKIISFFFPLVAEEEDSIQQNHFYIVCILCLYLRDMFSISGLICNCIICTRQGEENHDTIIHFWLWVGSNPKIWLTLETLIMILSFAGTSAGAETGRCYHQALDTTWKQSEFLNVCKIWVHNQITADSYKDHTCWLVERLLFTVRDEDL